jgi:hypothetical protein
MRPTWGEAVTTYIHLVFSDPPAGVADDEFNAWYEQHVEEILAVDGWCSATRYRVEGVVDAEHTGGYRYLSLYELDAPPDVALANLEAAGMGDASSYVDKQDRLPLPDWFPQVRFGSWNGTEITGGAQR